MEQMKKVKQKNIKGDKMKLTGQSKSHEAKMPQVIKIIGVLALVIVSTCTTQASDWPMFRYDAAHTGYTDEKVSDELESLWNFETSGEVDSSPTVANDKVFVGSSDNKIYCFGAKQTTTEQSKVNTTPTLIWKSEGICAAVSSDGEVAAGNTFGDVRLLDSTGKTIWEYDAPSGHGDANDISISSEGNYIAAGIGKSVYFFDEEGNLLWIYNITGGYEVNSISISPDGNYIAIGSDDKNVYLFDKNGRLLWKHICEYQVNKVSTSLNGNYVVATSYSTSRSTPKIVYLFNQKGKLLWKKETLGYHATISSDGKYMATCCWDDDYWGSVCFFDNNGKLFWKHGIGLGCGDLSLSLNGDYVVLGTFRPTTSKPRYGDNNIYLFDKNGQLLWKYNITYGVLSEGIRDISISPKGKYIVAASDHHQLYLLDNSKIVSPTPPEPTLEIPVGIIIGGIILASALLALILYYRIIQGRKMRDYKSKIEQWKECENCHKEFDANLDVCPHCGWSKTRIYR
jgi:outer membrane protein assembly factor BamB